MATLEYVRVAKRQPVLLGHEIGWAAEGRLLERLPQLFWDDQSTWGEANLWSLELAETRDVKTVRSAMHHLLGYANWLEKENVHWWDFPARMSERCLTRFRGQLIMMRDHGIVAASTASVRMSTVIRFYRWLMQNGLLSTSWPMWAERQVGIRLSNGFGLEHTLNVVTTDLAIPSASVAGAIGLEDGVMPLSNTGMKQVLELADARASAELQLMLRIGFGSGLRLGSILDLKLDTLQHASEDHVPGWHRLAVGPGASPTVATKFGHSGLVPIPTGLLHELCEYSESTRRLRRQAIAESQNRDLLFLTRFGRPYFGLDTRAVNVEVHRLRTAGEECGIEVMRNFHFHRTRATFATMLMRAALKCLPVGDAVQFVREACLHKDEATTLQYVKFIESTLAMAEAADAFTEAFMGLARGKA